MTTPKLINTDTIMKAAHQIISSSGGHTLTNGNGDILVDARHPINITQLLLAIQDDITRPLYNIIQGYKHLHHAYEGALHELKEKNKEYAKTQIGNVDPYLNNIMIINKALKGDYHKTDFTEYCEHNPITEEL